MQLDDRPVRGSYRLTVGIDRADNSKTTSFLYAPVEEPITEPPLEAWTWIEARFYSSLGVINLRSPPGAEHLPISDY